MSYDCRIAFGAPCFYDSRDRTYNQSPHNITSLLQQPAPWNIPAAIVLDAKGSQGVLRETHIYGKADAESTRLCQKAKWPKSFTISYSTVAQLNGETCMVFVDCNNELWGSNPGSVFNTDIERVPTAAPISRSHLCSSQTVTAMTR
jgi:hypothetical protein